MTNQKSYSQILKSSSMVGGSQLIRMMIGVVSTKFAAILIGPSGVGLIGAYQSIIQLGIQLAGLGINQSGVRDVAVSSGSEDEEAVARTVSILRRMCWLTGLVGAVVLAALAVPVSQLTFGNSDHAVSLMLLSMVVLVTTIAQGQMAVIQGLRRITDLVRVQILGSTAGAVISIGLYASFGKAGIVPSLMAIALFNLGSAWWFSRKLFERSIPMSWRETFSGAKSLLGLGAAFMVGGLATTFTAYATRALIVRDIGMDGLGMYQAAFSISGYVLNFVLGAMGADFYPRLAGVSEDHEEMVCLVNEQTEIGLLLATPAIVATLALAPLAINLLYSTQFAPAVDLLRWFAMGCFLRVISWPMAFIQLAKGEKYWFISSEIFFNVLHIFFIFVGLRFFGLCGAAIAFFSMYVLYVFGVRLIARHLICFSWDKATKRLIISQLFIVGCVFVGSLVLPGLWSMAFGGILSFVVGAYSLRQLLARLGKEHRVYRMIVKIPFLGKMFNPYH
ncbi:polysaccharide transporter, PST family [Desulfocicer vacuolatum DSM 3385]|uniref:Polysaccharide transporter, PST family n=1 Tax=Desulfocicer vacuolatum DSM 3385 TaxID=1121400 RepID=A0A1W1Z5C8_9BACT|nr:O-antigen translocase [Desulfocicer vacuolatum]SMC43603.1 polysaccharide transporter, PST family [Desulfocicer vacuolatum DSM 3385]